MGLPDRMVVSKYTTVNNAAEIKKMYLHQYIHLQTDTKSPITFMIVTRVIGGWIYEVAARDATQDKQTWKPVFVPEQTDVAGAVGDAIYNAITNLGSISVRVI